MSDFVERAAKAMCASQLYASAWDGLVEGAQETYRVNARAALAAALDPEDDRLRGIIAATLAGAERTPGTHGETARMILAALKALAAEHD